MADNEVKLRLSVDGSAQVVSGMDAVSSSMQTMETAAGYAKTALVAFAGVASISAFKGMVQGSIEASAGLHDMAIQTGASVAALTAFRAVAATTSTSIEGVAGAMNRMAKGMAVANEDSKGIGQAIKALGVNFDNLRQMKPEDQMLAVAKAMDGFQDGAGKAAVAMALYGKEGAKMLPFMKDLADSSEEVSKKLTEQQIAAKAAQAAMADDYTDNLTKIQKASEAWKKDVSMAMLPALYELTQAFIDVNKGAGGIKKGISDLSADGSITAWSRNAIFGVTYVMDGFEALKVVIQSVGKAVGANIAIMVENASMAWNVFTGLLGKEPVINIINASMARQKVIAQSLAEDLDKAWGNETFGKRLRDRLTEIEGVAVVAKKAKADLNFKTPDEKLKDGADKISDYQKLTRVIAEKQAQDSLQLTTGRSLYESEKIRAKMIADLSTGTIKLSEIEQTRINIGLEQLSVTEQLIAADKYYEEQQKARYAASSALVKAATDEADKNEQLARTFGLTQSAIAALEIARLEEQLAQKTSINQCTEETAKLEALIAAKKRSAVALGSIEAQQANKDAATKAAAEWQKTADKINDSITDALMRGFESGKGFAENLRDTLTNMFKTMVLRPTVSAIVNPVGQAMASAVGFGGGGEGGGGGMIGTALNAASLIGGSTLAAIGSSVATGVSAGLAGTSLAGATAAYSAAGMSGVAGGLSVGSTIGSALSAMGPVGWAALAAGAVLALADHGTPTSSTGDASASFDASGKRTDYQTFFNGSSVGVDKMLADLQAAYAGAAKSLGIGTVASAFAYGGNTGKNGESPNFALTARAGNSFYSTGGETASSDAAIALAASRAVFAALQGSELPAYLSSVFNGLNAGAMTQEQITNTLAYAGSIKQVREALLETREPMAILQANVDQAFRTLATTSESFKTDFVSAIDGGISPEKLAQWQSLQTAMTELASLAEKEATAKEAAAQKVRESIQKEVEKEIATVTSWTQKLAVLQGTVTERQLAMQADLATTSNAATQELIKQVYAQEDLQAATQTAKDSLKTLSESLKSLSSGVTGAQGTITDLQLQAQIDAANTANAAAEKFRGLNKSLREFLDGETLAPSASFGKLLAKAMGGDADAMQALPGAATASIEFAKNRASTSTEFALQKAGILTQVAQAANAAALLAAQTVAVPQAADPMAQAITALETAVRELKDGIAQSIGVDLVNRIGEIDTNLSGSIDRLEFGRYFDGLASDATLQSIYTQLDVNGDGQITKLEAIRVSTDAATSAVGSMQSVISNTLLNGFSKIDTSVNGLLDYPEFAAGLNGLATDAQIKTLFTEIDVNGDGQITQLEAIRLATLDIKTASAATAASTSIFASGDFRTVSFSPSDPIRSVFNNIDQTNQLLLKSLKMDLTYLLGTWVDDNLNAQGTLDSVFKGLYNIQLNSSQYLQTIAANSAYFGQMAANSATTAANTGGINHAAADGYLDTIAYHVKTYLQWIALQAYDINWRLTNGTLVKFDRAAYTGGVYAHGGAFTNSVVSTPTSFDMGLMGEAGPEAIMPLVNIGGNLGVRSTGGNGRDMARLEALVERLTKEVQGLRTEARATASNTGNAAKDIRGFRDRGLTVKTDAETPLQVEVIA